MPTAHDACCRYTCANEEVYSCTFIDNIVAGGSNGKLWFWDRRQQKVLQTMSDTHMDMVTVAAFHPLQPHLFFSGSDDGLIAAFDFSQGLNEDDGFAVCSHSHNQHLLLRSLTANVPMTVSSMCSRQYGVQAAVNVRNAPVDMQFYGPGKEKLWCRTATETVHFWDWGGSIRQHKEDYMAVEEDPTASTDSYDMMDAREQLNTSLQQDPGNFKGQVCCHRHLHLHLLRWKEEQGPAGSYLLSQRAISDYTACLLGGLPCWVSRG